jgi:queuine/archaeosine tRNA-ribosyltransferase
MRPRKSIALSLRVAPDVAAIVDRLSTEHHEWYYKQDLVSAALRWFDKTLTAKKLKAGDDLEKALGI